jgi:hypothetical protein
MTDFCEQAVGICTFGTDAFSNATADRLIVRQEIVEDVDNRSADVAVFSQRQG